MTANLNFKIFSVFTLLCSFALIIAAQEKPQALKFDEFFEDTYQKVDVTDKANRFARYIKKDLASDFYVIYYNPRKSKYGLEGKKSAEYAQGVLVNGYKISQKQIVLIDGGIRNNKSLEFWIVPQGADAPKPRPDFEKNEAIFCPLIRIEGENFQFNKEEPLKFSVITEGGELISKLDYEWNISAGKIVEGNRTSQIKIDVSETTIKRITASVQVKGYDPECVNQASNVTEVGMFPYKLAEFEYNYSYLAAVLDGMFNELSKNPTLKGYIIIYGRRIGNSKEVSRSINTTKQYLQFRHLDMSRISVVHGGFREEGAVEIYLIPKGINLPPPTPSIDEKFVVFTDRIKKSRKNKKLN